MRRRFFVEAFREKGAVLNRETAHHLAHVLRARPGQLYELSDGRAVWLARVERVGREAVEFSLVEPLPAREPALRVSLLLSIIKFDRFEWCLEKATELGVASVVPLAAARSDASLCRAAPRRAPRWRKILREAAQQARRVRPPALAPLGRSPEAFAEPASFVREEKNPSLARRILLSERPEAPPLRAILSATAGAASLETESPRGAVALAIGPEGGWTVEELDAARGAGFAEASLAGEILRTETAVIAALAILHYVLGGSPALV
jgi:16S rRNA (uracil1498-N3)-methyltransferase